MRIDIDYAEADFRYQGTSYQAIGGVVHNVTSEDVGIGSYEYWGQKSYDSKVVEVSEYGDAEFTIPDIYPAGSDTPLTDPSPALIEAAQEALFEKTQGQAEQKAMEES
jgi:hypothetical protein